MQPWSYAVPLALVALLIVAAAVLYRRWRHRISPAAPWRGIPVDLQREMARVEIEVLAQERRERR